VTSTTGSTPVRPTAAAASARRSASVHLLAAPLDTSTGYAYVHSFRWRAGPRWTTCWATTRCRTTSTSRTSPRTASAYPLLRRNPRRLPEPLADNTPMVTCGCRHRHRAAAPRHVEPAVKARAGHRVRVGSTVTIQRPAASRSPPPCLPVHGSRYCWARPGLRPRPTPGLLSGWAAPELPQSDVSLALGRPVGTSPPRSQPPHGDGERDRAASTRGCRCPQAPLTRCRLSRPPPPEQR